MFYTIANEVNEVTWVIILYKILLIYLFHDGISQNLNTN